MANELDSAITIKKAIDNIDSGIFLLPAIQRRFVWNTRQIEMLFVFNYARLSDKYIYVLGSD